MRRRWILGICVLIAVVTVGAAGYFWQRSREGDRLLFEAEEALEEQDWPSARINAKRLVRRSQHLDDARMILAEATIRDPGIEPQKAIDDALSYLEDVGGEKATQARIRQAELRLLILKQPKRAEEVLLSTIESAPDSYEAHYLLWTILVGTSRSHETHDLFWRIHELAPESEQFVVLRQWFLCEFATSNFNINLDRAIGVLGPNDNPVLRTSFRRLLMFRNGEPDRADNVAALASWFELQTDAEQAFKLLQEASSANGIWDSELFVGCLVRTCFDLGVVDEAKSYFEKWPEPKQGYDYWRTKGTIEQELDRDYESAIASFEQAAASWPGNSDWSLYFRMATCAEILGLEEDAKRFREEGEAIRLSVHQDVLNELLVLLAKGQTPETIDRMIEFYRSIDREREAKAWEALQK